MTGHRVVIAGAGLAGARAAETLRAEGFDGDIVLVGDEPVGPYERPALSKEFLAGARDEESLLLRKPSFWEERSIELLLRTSVVEVDPARGVARTDRGRDLGFDDLVLATGARPRKLSLERPDGVHELRTLADAQRLRRELKPGARLVVIGGGFVGAEVASTARSLGVEVSIVEAALAPAVRVLGPRVGLLLADRWRREGVAVRLRTNIMRLRANGSGRIESVQLANGEELPADAVLVGIGVEPARELLSDATDQRIHPAGDVTGTGHWTAASHDGAAAARRILGLPAPPARPEYVWSDQFGLRLQIVGTPRPEHTPDLEGDENSFSVRYVDTRGRTCAALFANRPTEAAELRRAFTEDALALAA